MPSNHFLFVVDTDHYAGNFERQMCAYVTGMVGECGVGEEEEVIFEEEVDINPLLDEHDYSIVMEMPTGDGLPCMRPCEIYPNPRWFNHGMGGHFRYDDPEAEEKALADWKRETIKNAKKGIKNAKAWKWSKGALANEVERRQNEIQRAENKTQVNHYPAYMSVAIFLEERPSESQIEFLKKRSHKFFEEYLPNEDDSRMVQSAVTIEGFRLVEVVVNHIEEEL